MSLPRLTSASAPGLESGSAFGLPGSTSVAPGSTPVASSVAPGSTPVAPSDYVPKEYTIDNMIAYLIFSFNSVFRYFFIVLVISWIALVIVTGTQVSRAGEEKYEGYEILKYTRDSVFQVIVISSFGIIVWYVFTSITSKLDDNKKLSEVRGQKTNCNSYRDCAIEAKCRLDKINRLSDMKLPAFQCSDSCDNSYTVEDTLVNSKGEEVPLSVEGRRNLILIGQAEERLLNLEKSVSRIPATTEETKIIANYQRQYIDGYKKDLQFIKTNPNFIQVAQDLKVLLGSISNTLDDSYNINGGVVNTSSNLDSLKRYNNKNETVRELINDPYLDKLKTRYRELSAKESEINDDKKTLSNAVSSLREDKKPSNLGVGGRQGGNIGGGGRRGGNTGSTDLLTALEKANNLNLT